MKYLITENRMIRITLGGNDGIHKMERKQNGGHKGVHKCGAE